MLVFGQDNHMGYFAHACLYGLLLYEGRSVYTGMEGIKRGML